MVSPERHGVTGTPSNQAGLHARRLQETPARAPETRAGVTNSRIVKEEARFECGFACRNSLTRHVSHETQA
jgi:hypothetical protein